MIKNSKYSVLSKIEQSPFGIRLTDGSWKLLSNLDESYDLLASMEKLISMSHAKKNISTIEKCEWNRLISTQTSQYLKKHHPDLKLIDVSVSRDFTLFSQIQAHDINSQYWKGGNAGSVQFDFKSAKFRTIAEVIERTELSFVEHNTWASAIAPTCQLAEFHAKLESLERWLMLKGWQEDPLFQFTENIIPHFPKDQRSLMDAVAFEWDPYHAKISCFKLLNPFELECTLAVVEVIHSGRSWRFYGNGLDISLQRAAEKACLETLQFIPGPYSSMWKGLEKSTCKNDQRIFSWSMVAKNHLFDNSNNIEPDWFTSSKEDEKFHIKINQAFKTIPLEIQFKELKECSNVFMSYVSSSIDWREERAVPIV